jgi:glucose-6-phosphate isomerase
MAPLALLGIDTAALRKGARDACKAKALAAAGDHAAIIAYQAQHGKDIFDFFTFSDRLAGIGLWYRQLLAESIGKATTCTGTPFTLTLLPTVSTARDLHSMAQLYLSGKKNIHTRFFHAKESSTRSIPLGFMPATTDFLKGHTCTDIQNAIIQGIRAAYDAQDLAYTHTELNQIDAYEIGFLLASLMCEVMCLAEILDINAFDQPNVESYKQHAKTALT